MENYVTKEGLKRMREELKELKTTRRRELAEKLQRAIAAGDLSENAEYAEAKEEQAFMEGRIAELERAVASAVVIEERHSVTVKIGSTVLVERIDKGHKRQVAFAIVGSEETDPAGGKISYLSPLGAALMGHRSGDIVEITTPSGAAKWKIKGVK